MSAAGRRAAPGGERGINGEWYQGGQFMPASAFTVKGAHRATSGKAGDLKRVLIAPGQLEWIPREAGALFPQIREHVDFDMIDGQAGPMRKKPRPHGFPWEAHFRGGEAELDRLIDAYNRGQRLT